MNMKVKLEKAQDALFALPNVAVNAQDLSKTLKAVKESFDALKQMGFALAKPIVTAAQHLEVVSAVNEVCHAFVLGTQIFYNDFEIFKDTAGEKGRSLPRKKETLAFKANHVSKLGRVIIAGIITGEKLKVYVLPTITKMAVCRLPVIHLALHIVSVAENIFAIIDSLIKIVKAQNAISDSKWEKKQLTEICSLDATGDTLTAALDSYNAKISALEEKEKVLRRKNKKLSTEDWFNLSRWKSQRTALLQDQLRVTDDSLYTPIGPSKDYQNLCEKIVELTRDSNQAAKLEELIREKERQEVLASSRLKTESDDCDKSLKSAQTIRTDQLFVLAEAVAKLASTIISLSLEVTAYTCPPLAASATVLSAASNWAGVASSIKDGYRSLRKSRKAPPSHRASVATKLNFDIQSTSP